MMEDKKENSNWNVFLFITFWLVVLIECVGLLNKNYIEFGFSRIFLIPILLVRVLWSPVVKKLSIYYYLFLIFSLLADLMTIFGNLYIGLNLFTVIFLSLGCYFQQIKDNHNYSHLVFIITFILIGIGCSLWFYAPELRHEIYYAQILFHGLVLMNLIFRLFTSHQKVNTKLFGGFLMAVLVILITNLLYGLDALYLHWRYSFIESLVGLGNGVYIFLVTKGALRYVKRGHN